VSEYVAKANVVGVGRYSDG